MPPVWETANPWFNRESSFLPLTLMAVIDMIVSTPRTGCLFDPGESLHSAGVTSFTANEVDSLSAMPFGGQYHFADVRKMVTQLSGISGWFTAGSETAAL